MSEGKKRVKKASEHDPDATINDIPERDPDHTIVDARPFDPNATIQEDGGSYRHAITDDVGGFDADATIEHTGEFKHTGESDPNATIVESERCDPNAAPADADHVDAEATVEVADHFEGDATFEHTAAIDPHATIDITGDYSVDSGTSPDSGEARSILEDTNLSQTINPRSLSSAEAKYWAEISSEFTSSSEPTTVRPLPVNRTIIETKLQLRNQTVATQAHGENEPADYRLVRLLGRGGMGNVFVARQGSLDRLIAVKVIRPLDESKRTTLTRQGQLETVEQSRRQQFLTEAVVTGDLDHPNIVPIHDVAVTGDSTLFYSMKRVVGTPWSDVIKEKSRDENLEILIKVADAIGFAHTRGVVHRDIKPENVMLGDFGVVMVMDWGIALAKPNFEKLDSITPATGLGGTPSMMAPEMATGPLEKIGPAADVYLLGATLFMIITGNPPHHAPNVSQCLRAVANNDIREFAPEYQGELMSIALKAMSMDPAERYVDTKAFQDAIRKYRSHAESISLVKRAEEDLQLAKNEKSYTQFTRAQFGFEEALALWSGNEAARDGLRRAQFAHAEAAYQNEDFDLGLSLLNEGNPDHGELIERLRFALLLRRHRESRFAALKKVAAALLAFILIGGSVAIFFINQARSQADRNAELAIRESELAELQRNRADANAAKAVDNAKKARESATKANVAQAHAEYETYVSEVGLAKARIDRNEFTEARRLLQELIGERAASEIPWELRYLSSLANQSTASLSTPTEVAGLAVGRQSLESSTSTPAVICYEDGTLATITIDADSDPPITLDTPLPVPLPDNERASSVAIADNNTLAAVGTDGGDILLIDPGKLAAAKSPSDLSIRRLLGHNRRVTSVQWMDDEYLISASDDHTLRIWNIQNATAEEVLWHIAPVVDVDSCMTSEGFRIAAGVAEKRVGQVVIWDVRVGEKLQANRRGVFSEHASPLTSVAISPDGQLVASGEVDGNVVLWSVSQLHKRDLEGTIKPAVETATEGGGKASKVTRVDTEDADQSIAFTRLSSPDLDADSSTETSQATPAHRSNVRNLRFSSSGETLLTCGDDYLIHLWRVQPPHSATELPEFSLQRTLRGHGGNVTAAAFLTANGNQVLSVGEDDTIRLWRFGAASAGSCSALASHEPVLTRVHDDAISSATLSADGKRVLTASRDHTAQVLTIDPVTLHLESMAEMATGESSGNNNSHRNGHPPSTVALDEGTEFRAMSMRVNRVANRLFVGGADAVVRIWDLERGTELSTISNTGLHQVLAVSNDASVILTGSSIPETRAILWRFDPKTSAAVTEHRLAGHEEAVTAAAIAPDIKRALTADRAGRIILWDVESGKPVGDPIDNLLGIRINDAVFSADGASVWIAADDEQLSRLDLESRMIVDRLDHDGVVTHVELSRDGLRAVTSSELQKVDSTIHRAELWQLPAGDVPAEHVTLVTQTVKSEDRTHSGGRPGIASVSIDNSGHRALVAINPAGDHVSRVERYHVDDDIKQRSRERVLGLPSRLGDVTAAIPVDSNELITLQGNSAFRWNTTTRSLEVSYRIHGALSVAAISPDSSIVITGSRSLKAWDTRAGVALAKLESPHDGVVRSLTFVGKAAPMEFFSGGDDGVIRRWSFRRKSGKIEQLGTIAFSDEDAGGDPEVPLSLTISPDSRELLVTTDRGKVAIYDLESGRERLVFSNPAVGMIDAGCFSPDGRFVAAGGHDQLARMWDLSKPRSPADPPEVIFQGHAEAIRGIALILSTDGTARREESELSTSSDVRGRPATMSRSDEQSRAATMSTLRLFTASLDRSIRVWDPHLTHQHVGDGDVSTPQKIPAGRELLELIKHRDGVTAIDFNPDTTLMMTAGRDGNVILWPACDPR